MIQAEREKIIKEHVEKRGIVPIDELVRLTESSVSTIRRDLLSLESKGVIIRKRGGAVGQKKDIISQFSDISIRNAEEKRRIANKAIAMIAPGDSLFIGSGTTCDILCEELQGIPNLNIVTTSVYGAMLLSRSKASNTVLLGGKVYCGNNFYETVGDFKELNHLNRKYNFNKVFISLDGVDLVRGYFLQKEEQIPLYRLLMESSDFFYVMLSSEKFGRRVFVNLCGIEEVQNLIVADKLPKKFKEIFSKNKINVF